MNQQRQQEQGTYFADIYQRLAAPFERTFKDNRGGAEFDYVTGEQVITRLNEVLGVAGWSFQVMEHGIDAEADEVWANGILVANFGGTQVTRQQFGSQKLKRRRQPREDGVREILDIGFDLKGAATDALKKCATLLGVALYLSHKEEGAHSDNGDSPRQSPAPRQQQPTPIRQNGPAQPAQEQHSDALVCAECAAPLKETEFRDGTKWTPAQLAGYGRRKHNRTLCMQHYREANEARKRAEAEGGEVAF